MGAYGLQTHIWNNQLKSLLLLAGFPALLAILLFGLVIGYVGIAESFDSYDEAWAVIRRIYLGALPFAVLGALVWFLIALAFHQQMIAASVGAKSLDRRDAPELYNLLENLCISRGIKMPRLSIVESSAMNAFASGVSDKNYAITVTRGLLDRLDSDELEAVLAHELTHIRNQDVRLLIVAVIFVGIFSFIGELIFEGLFRSGVRIGGHTRSRNGDSRGGGLLILIAIAMIAVAYILAIVIRFALSQRREYLADAGAVDLTRRSDAMIRALEKISGRSEIEAPADVRQMMVDNPVRFLGVFATHPPIEKRIEALRAYGA
ncbi:MAG: M48 family metalloprotease [Alphaproteobacteria bacterium]|nr:M48 family metalloprotease [Alphaproteobacteria bacterium]